MLKNFRIISAVLAVLALSTVVSACGGKLSGKKLASNPQAQQVSNQAQQVGNADATIVENCAQSNAKKIILGVHTYVADVVKCAVPGGSTQEEAKVKSCVLSKITAVKPSRGALDAAIKAALPCFQVSQSPASSSTSSTTTVPSTKSTTSSR